MPEGRGLRAAILMTDESYRLWDYTADYEAQNVAYPWAVYTPEIAGVMCWCVSRERAQLICDALNDQKEVERLRPVVEVVARARVLLGHGQAPDTLCPDYRDGKAWPLRTAARAALGLPWTVDLTERRRNAQREPVSPADEDATNNH